MRLFLTAFAILIVLILFKWIWDQAKTHDKKSLRYLLIVVSAAIVIVMGVSSANIEHHRISSSIQGVVTQFDTYRLRGDITHYSASIRGLAKSGAFVANQESLSVDNTPENEAIIATLEKAHRTRQVVFVTFDTVISYFFGDDKFELQSIAIAAENELKP